ncbi:MAG: outer membrane protein assembly factor BamC [Gammaproteobacteria bacterium]|nr:outer membrane protein assembly factor BamC [Gammaproteobacteria bacterium]
MSKLADMLRFVVVGVLISVVVGCASDPNKYKTEYGHRVDVGSLQVPPDLDNPVDNQQTELPPEITASLQSFNAYKQEQKNNPNLQVAPDYKNMRFVRAGDVFWLEIKNSPEHVWADVRDFFLKAGFQIKIDQPSLGILETDYQENRAEVPKNWFSKILNKVFSTGLLDKYRVRLERGSDPNTTLMFITHHGLKELAENEGPNTTLETNKGVNWVVREPDPELEAEMLMRFMAFRGVSEVAAHEAIASSASTTPPPALLDQNNMVLLEINDSFDRTWRHVELALDRMGFIIEDRNRSAGVYYIKLPENFRLNTDKGWLGGLFGKGASKLPAEKYLLVVENKGEKTQVSLRQQDGKSDDISVLARKILGQIRDNIS